MAVHVVVAGANQKMVTEVVTPLMTCGYQFTLVTTEVLEVGVLTINCETMKEVALEAVRCVRETENSILLKGQIQTADLLREVLKGENGLRRTDMLSQVTHIELLDSGRKFLLTDPALNVTPSVADKIAICENGIEVARKLGLTPKVAVLSAVEVLNPKIPSAVAAHEVVSYFKNTNRDVIIEGPISMDVATDSEAAKAKNYQGQIQGDATVLVAPGIDAANILYKTLAHFTNCRICGVLVGATVPIALTSRSDSGAAKIDAIKMAEQLIN